MRNQVNYVRKGDGPALVKRWLRQTRCLISPTVVLPDTSSDTAVPFLWAQRGGRRRHEKGVEKGGERGEEMSRVFSSDKVRAQ